MAYLEQSTRYVPYADRPGGRWRYHVPAEVRGHAARARVRGDARPHVRDLRPVARADAGALPPAPPAPAVGLRGRLPEHDPGEGARHPARAPSGRDAVERGALRHGPGVRGAPAAPPRVAARRGARVRGPHADRAAQGDPGVPPARGRPRPRRRLVGLPRGHARGHGRRRPRDALGADRPGAPPGGGPRGLRSRGRGEGRGRRALRGLGPPRRPAPRARPPDDAPRSGRAVLRGLRGRARGTGATSRGAPSSGRATGSTSSRTTARSATSSGTGSCRSSGSRSVPGTATRCPRRSRRRGGGADWRRVMDASAALHDALVGRGPRRRRRPTPCAWPTGSASTWR